LSTAGVQLVVNRAVIRDRTSRKVIKKTVFFIFTLSSIIL
jgi:hypothetical protein